MGTNYYVQTERCDKCGRHDDDIHLGKSSAGWQFSFQYNGGKYYKNVREMKKWLKDKIIKDEYGETISTIDFWKMVKAKQTPNNLNHAARYASEHQGNMVIDGYSFTDCEFS